VKAGTILAECDTLRDVVLPNLGVRLEDKEGEPAVIQQVPVTALVLPDMTKLFYPNFRNGIVPGLQAVPPRRTLRTQVRHLQAAPDSATVQHPSSVCHLMT
jgi:hypothetical protein